jgi:hypothetical protein
MIYRRKPKRVLVGIPHYFDQLNIHQNDFGSYENSGYNLRLEIVKKAILNLEVSLNSLDLNFEIKMFGTQNQFLVEPDVYLNVRNPKFLPWAAIDEMFKNRMNFDYFLFMEDDLIINADFMEKLMNLQKHLRNFETVIPNRLEFFNGKPFCVDIFALPGWKSESKFIDNQTFVEPINTHSGFMFLPRKTFLRAYKNRKYVHPTILISDYMESSLANIFSSMRVYRPIPTNSSLTIVHEDSWSSRMLEKDMFSLSDLSLFIESNSFVEIELVNRLNNHNAEF